MKRMDAWEMRDNLDVCVLNTLQFACQLAIAVPLLQLHAIQESDPSFIPI